MKRTASSEPGRIRAAILANVEESINDLLEESAILHHLAASGKITIVGAYYELSTGRVHFSEPITTPTITHSVAQAHQ